MDPQISQEIVTVLRAGASILGDELAKEFVRDAYNALKDHIQQYYSGARKTLVSLEKNPSSSQFADDLQVKLTEEQSPQDGEVVTLARNFIELMRSQPGMSSTAVGVSIDSLNEVYAHIAQVQASSNSIGVKIKEMKGGELHVGAVAALGEELSERSGASNASSGVSVDSASNSVIVNIANLNILGSRFNEAQNTGSEPGQNDVPVFGIKSFEHTVDRLEDRCDTPVLDLTSHFDGRFMRNGDDWGKTLYPMTRDFLMQAVKAHPIIRLNLDVHLTLAFAAGTILHLKLDRPVKLEQRGVVRTIWTHTDSKFDPTWPTLVSEILALNSDQPDLAVAVSFSNDCGSKVSRYCKETLPTVGRLLLLQPSTGCGKQSVVNGSHALKLADETCTAISRAQSPAAGRVTHLFVAGPKSFAFILGQIYASLGPVQFYEYDFENERDGLYTPSLKFPVSR